MRRTTHAATLGAVAFAAALGLSGCGDDDTARPPAPIETLTPITKPPTVTASQPSATIAPLPPPTALTDVLAGLTDPNIPGAEKLDLVENATPADGVSMDKFGAALRDGGYLPVTFEAKDLRWAEGQQGVVLAVVTFNTANPASGNFRFPMEFRYADDHWQLTRRTSDTLLHLGDNPAPTSTPTPTP